MTIRDVVAEQATLGTGVTLTLLTPHTSATNQQQNPHSALGLSSSFPPPLHAIIGATTSSTSTSSSQFAPGSHDNVLAFTGQGPGLAQGQGPGHGGSSSMNHHHQHTLAAAVAASMGATATANNTTTSNGHNHSQQTTISLVGHDRLVSRSLIGRLVGWLVYTSCKCS